MGKYLDAYQEFKAKYDLDLKIQDEYAGAKALSSIDDFSMDTSPQKKAQSVYVSTLSSALASYINKRVKMDSGKSYDLSNINVHDFIAEFDKVMNAIRSDEAEGKRAEYKHRKFEGMSPDKVANDVWNRVAPAFHKTLPTMWKEKIRSGSMKIEDMRNTTNNLFVRLAPDEMEGVDRTQLHDELTTVVAAFEAMKQVRETRKGFIGFFWRLIYREQNSKEENYINGLRGQIATLQDKGYDVEGVTNALNGKTILAREVAGATDAKAAEHEEDLSINAERGRDKERVTSINLGETNSKDTSDFIPDTQDQPAKTYKSEL